MPSSTDRLREARLVRLAALLKAERERRGWSLSKVAELSGLDHTMILRVENRERTPTIDTLWRIADALEVDLWKLIRAAENPAD